MIGCFVFFLLTLTLSKKNPIFDYGDFDYEPQRGNNPK